VLTERYQGFVGDLETDRVALERAKSRLDADRAALAMESPAVDLTETISSDVLLLLLAANPGAVDPADFPDLLSTTQEINPVYFELQSRVAATESDIAALEASVAYLEPQIEALSAEIDDLSAQSAVADATLGRIDRELEILDADFSQLGQAVQEARIAREEQAGAIQVVEEAVVPAQALGSGRMQSLILAAFLGLLVGVVAALLLEFLLSIREENRRSGKRPPEPESAA
jgi:septal ring factor EnvC (AmiA/AmiB activator)